MDDKKWYEDKKIQHEKAYNKFMQCLYDNDSTRDELTRYDDHQINIKILLNYAETKYQDALTSYCNTYLGG